MRSTARCHDIYYNDVVVTTKASPKSSCNLDNNTDIIDILNICITEVFLLSYIFSTPTYG